MRAFIAFVFLFTIPAHAGLADRSYTSPADASASVRELGLALRKKGDTRALFPLVYSLTIKATERKLARGEFRNPAWVRSLIVNYANLYRRTVRAELAGQRASLPASWRLAFSYSNTETWNADLDLVYGIHVHIARDLVEALLITPTNFRSPSVQADYLLVTEALREAMPEIWNVFLGYSSQRLLPALERSVMMSWIAELRVRAWHAAADASHLDRAGQAQALRILDAKVARRSRRHGTLLPVLRF